MTPFEETRPYNDSEVPAAISRIAADPFFGTIVSYLFPNQDVADFKKKFLAIKTVKEFQENIMFQALQSIISKTCDHFTNSGFESLSNDRNYMFIANHRDIMLDAALLQIILNQHQLDTSEITFGSNLM